MTTFQVGRVGFDVVTSAPRTIEDDGDVFSFRGKLHCPGDTEAETLANARVLRDQLLGYVGNLDEEAVPVLHDIDRRYEGFARVLDAGVTIDRDHLFAGHIPFFVRLERVAGGGGVLVESRFSGPVRPNNHSITSSDVHGYHGVPFPILSYSHPATTSAAVVNLAEGGARVYDVAEVGFAGTTARWSVSPEDWYEAACTITSVEGGAPLVGRKVGRFDEDHPIIRASNGLVRFTFYGTGGLVGSPGSWPTGVTIDAERWDGSAWVSNPVILVSKPASSWLEMPEEPWGWSILRNGPECVAVRVHFSDPANPESTYTVDMALRRAAEFAEFFAVSPSSVQSGVLFESTGNTAALTGGAASEADGNDPVVVGTPRVFDGVAMSISGDTFAGIGAQASSETFPFMVGFQQSAGGVAATAQDLVDAYHLALTETVRIVAA